MSEFAALSHSPGMEQIGAIISYNRDSLLSSSRRTVIDMQKDEIKKEQSTIEELQRQLQGQEDTIAELMKQLDEAKKHTRHQAEEHSKEISVSNEAIVKLTSQNQSLIHDNELCRVLPDKQAEEINNLRFEMESVQADSEEIKDKLQASMVTIELLTELKHSNKDLVSSLQQDMEDQHQLQEDKIEQLQAALSAGIFSFFPFYPSFPFRLFLLLSCCH